MPRQPAARPTTAKARPRYMAFLSYCHKDDDTDGKWITKAAQVLAALVRRETGDEFPIFEDFLDTPIGDWKKYHREVLDTAPFLIVFITPCFLKSSACRREVNRFSKGQGSVIPIFYLPVEPETATEIRLHARLVKWQAEPWMGLSDVCGPESKKARPKLVTLARRIKAALKSGTPASPTVPVVRGRRARAGQKVAVAAAVGREEAKAAAVGPGLQFTGKNDKGFEEYLSPVDGAVMVKIPAGTFKMGSTVETDEKPVHEVILPDYYIDKCPVTNAQYKRFCDATGRDYPQDPGFAGMDDYFTRFADYPVVNVSWDDAQAYCAWAGKRLPTEAEWEKAARGVDGRKYPWGNEEPDGTQCNFADKRSGLEWADKNVDDGFARTSPVGHYLAGASPFGVLDMAGNVWEWCNDWYADDYYRRSPAENPKGPDSGSARVLRGGSWYDEARRLRCAYRLRLAPSERVDLIGFRCAVDK